MSENVLIAVLTLFGTIITVYAGQKRLKDDISAQLDKHNAVQDERIKALTDKVDKHNKVVERTYELERKVAVLESEVNNHG